MYNPNQELIFSVLKFFNEKGYKETAHMFERESKCYFNRRYFEEMVLSANWDEAEKYLSDFTQIDDNQHSTKTYFLIRRNKFLEALDRNDRAKALEIFKKDLKTFSDRSVDLYKEVVQLMTLDDIWKHDSLSKYGNLGNASRNTVLQLNWMIEMNPLFIGKLEFPSIVSQSLQCLFNQRVESGYCFDMKYFEEMMLSGNWDEAEKYISGFTKIGDNSYSNDIFLLIRKCKFLEALDRKDHVKATEILVNDLVMFKPINGDFFKQMAQLLKLDDIWKHKSVLEFEDFESLRRNTALQLKNIIEANPLFNSKLKSPSIKSQSDLDDAESSKISKTERKDTYLNNAVGIKWQCMRLSYTEGYDISALTYTNEGDAVLLLLTNAHILWKWPGQVNAIDRPWICQPKDAFTMKNEYGGINHEVVDPYFALSTNDSYLYSASGGKVSVFNMKTLEKEDSIMPPPPAATCIAIDPDSNKVAIGMRNSTIIIYNRLSKEIEAELVGHTGRVTGLAFSKALNILVSSGADAKIFTWNVNRWKKRLKTLLLLRPTLYIDIWFHQDQRHFLLVHKYRLAIYRAYTLKCELKWTPSIRIPISFAKFSCDGQVYASFCNGDIIIFDGSTLGPLYVILGEVYMEKNRSFGHTPVIAAHPKKPYQFAVGLSNGDCYVIEKEETAFDPLKMS
ncbi:protein TPR3 isoform X1 [Ziziphus jujuba]|uniref:Protein TPR3 isoform X1 n=1 Tax=Ziziphus jujuba TaxID=326968 RepID=A0ABM3INW4_ZIZJJ|nr:protein TPR3 isoform X1 [Ziziphus jujuba]XP_060673724.1 protein TPR3 isoform X1 [Ziziphus jujuba]